MRFMFVLSSLALLSATASSQTEKRWLPNDIEMITHSKGSLYVTTTGRPEGLAYTSKDLSYYLGPFIIYKATCTPVPNVQQYMLFDFFVPISQARLNFRVLKETIFLSAEARTYREVRLLPFSKLQNIETDDSKLKKLDEDELFELRGYQLGLYKISADPTKIARDNYWRKKNGGLNYPLDWYFPLEASCNDFIPESDKSLLLFTIRDNQMLFHTASTKENTFPKEEGRVDCPFRVPFRAFKVAGSFYFVLRTGEVFTWLNRGEKRDHLSPIYAEVDRPINTVYVDCDRDKIYAFTKPRKENGKLPSGNYFELGKDALTSKEFADSPKSFELRPFGGNLPVPVQNALSYHEVVSKAGR